MEPEQLEMVRKIEVAVLGSLCTVEIFKRSNGKGIALTRHSHEDIIITDGKNAEDAFQRHSVILPLALGCRQGKKPVTDEVQH